MKQKVILGISYTPLHSVGKMPGLGMFKAGGIFGGTTVL
jgi:hypothetical protein